MMLLLAILGAMVVIGVGWGLLTRHRPTYREDEIRSYDPRLAKRLEGGSFMSDGGHHKEDWRPNNY